MEKFDINIAKLKPGFLWNLCGILFLSPMIMTISLSAVDASEDHELSLILTKTAACQGSGAGCMEGENEFDLDSEINHRILATTNYMSYGALQRNTVPCSQRGASYYNCQRGVEANPFNRGCSAITRCGN